MKQGKHLEKKKNNLTIHREICSTRGNQKEGNSFFFSFVFNSSTFSFFPSQVIRKMLGVERVRGAHRMAWKGGLFEVRGGGQSLSRR